MLVRHQFGPEGAAYIRSYLASNDRFGTRLGRLLARREIEAGTVSAFVPAESSAAQRVNFEAGGLFSRRSRECAEDPSPKARAIAWLSLLLGEGGPSPRILCIEDARTRRAAVETKLPHVKFFFCGDDVYWYAMDGALEDISLEWVPLSGALADPNIGIVATLPAGLKSIRNRQSVNSAAVQEIATGAVAVIVGAWDWEGFMIWEPGREEQLNESGR
jgi:hypothetical protein